jgi:hypothetical protein
VSAHIAETVTLDENGDDVLLTIEGKPGEDVLVRRAGPRGVVGDTGLVVCQAAVGSTGRLAVRVPRTDLEIHSRRGMVPLSLAHREPATATVRLADSTGPACATICTSTGETEELRPRESAANRVRDNEIDRTKRILAWTLWGMLLGALVGPVTGHFAGEIIETALIREGVFKERWNGLNFGMLLVGAALGPMYFGWLGMRFDMRTGRTTPPSSTPSTSASVESAESRGANRRIRRERRRHR